MWVQFANKNSSTTEKKSCILFFLESGSSDEMFAATSSLLDWTWNYIKPMETLYIDWCNNGFANLLFFWLNTQTWPHRDKLNHSTQSRLLLKSIIGKSATNVRIIGNVSHENFFPVEHINRWKLACGLSEFNETDDSTVALADQMFYTWASIMVSMCRTGFSGQRCH